MTSQVMGRRLRVHKHCVALSLLSLAGLPVNSVAAATVTISTATTTALQTATAGAGSTAADIAIASGGSIVPTTAAAPAITLNSNNAVSNAGAINFADLDNTIGIEVQSGFTGSVSNTGGMTIGPASSTAGTGVHQNYANNKAAIRVDAGTFNGNIDNAAGGTITVNGDSSFGMDIQGAVTSANPDPTVPAIGNEGTITVVGDNSVGIRIRGALTGNFTSNNVSVNGKGDLTSPGGPASAILIEAPITGAFKSTGAINVSGYDHPPSTAASNDNATQTLQQSGPAVGIGSSISGGILFNGPSAAERLAVANGTEPTANETAQSSVTSLSSSPAILISPKLAVTPGDITIGVVNAADVTMAFGLVNRGTISGNSEYDGVSAEAIRIDDGGTGHTTTLTGGLRNDGAIQASALSNFANALVVGNLATVPVISNTGVIQTQVSANGSFNSTGILIEPGGKVGEIDNTGKISATFVGATGNAVAISDQSGTLTNTLTTINNTGEISAAVGTRTNPDGTTTAPTGKAIAVDLSATSNDITITNDLPTTANPSVASGGVITGDVLFGSGNDTFAMNNGTVTGNIVFGNGNDRLIATGGTIFGDLDFGTSAGAGHDEIFVDGGAVVQGGLTAAGALSIDVEKGTLLITSAKPVTITTATFGSQSVLGVAIDANSGTSTQLNASGTVSFAAGAKIAPLFSGTFAQTITSTIVTSPDLQIAGGDASSLLSAGVPFVYNAAISETPDHHSLDLTLTRKTTQELGIPQKLSPVLNALLGALPRDPNLESQFLTLSTQSAFDAGFEQLLPSYTDATLAMAKQSTMASSRQIRERLENALGERRAGGAWVSESIYSLNRQLAGGTRGYDAQGTVLGIGLDDYLTQGILAGIEFGLDHGSYQEDGDLDSPVSIRRWMGGAYIGARSGKLVLSGSLLGAVSTTDSKRKIVLGTQTRTTSGQWHGSRYSADLAATYLEKFGRWSITPMVGVQYLHLNEDGYTEKGGTDPTVTTSPGNSVALQVSPRSADAAIAYGQVVIGYDLNGLQTIVPYEPGQPFILRPEIKFGFMHDFINTPIDTKARYVGDASYFVIPSDPRDTQSFNAGVAFNFETAYGTIGVDGNGVFGDHTTAFVGKINATFRF